MALLEAAASARSSARCGRLTASIYVEAGTFHGLIGPNGSGKSTLLKAIAGAHFADGGTIVFDGRDITRATPSERARAGLSLKFQITAVLPELSVYDNVLLAMQSHESLLQPAALALAPRAARARSRPCSSASGWSTAPTISPASSATASSSGSRSPWRWRPSPSCCCSTSRPPA